MHQCHAMMVCIVRKRITKHTIGNKCTIDTCVGGVCVHSPVSCPSITGCGIATCFPYTGLCDYSGTSSCNLAHGVKSLGDDGYCIISEQCADTIECNVDVCNPVTHSCVHVEKDCSDGDACTLDVCLEKGGCQHTPISLVGESGCVEGLCCHLTGTIVPMDHACNDFDECSMDMCLGNGTCKHVPYALPPEGANDTIFIDPVRCVVSGAVDGECMTMVCVNATEDGVQHKRLWIPKKKGSVCLHKRSICDGCGNCIDEVIIKRMVGVKMRILISCLVYGTVLFACIVLVVIAIATATSMPKRRGLAKKP
jgi:hypothetical protein